MNKARRTARLHDEVRGVYNPAVERRRGKVAKRFSELESRGRIETPMERERRFSKRFWQVMWVVMALAVVVGTALVLAYLTI